MSISSRNLTGCSKCETIDSVSLFVFFFCLSALADIETGVENIVIGQSIQRNTKEECSKGEDEGFDENDDGDSSGWITPDNLRHAREQMGQATLHPFSGVVTVGCLTTDFAMQVEYYQTLVHLHSPLFQHRV